MKTEWTAQDLLAEMNFPLQNSKRDIEEIQNKNRDILNQDINNVGVISETYEPLLKLNISYVR